MKKALLILISLYAICANAVTLDQVKFSNEATDTTKITDILISTERQNFDHPNDRISYIAHLF